MILGLELERPVCQAQHFELSFQAKNLQVFCPRVCPRPSKQSPWPLGFFQMMLRRPFGTRD